MTGLPRARPPCKLRTAAVHTAQCIATKHVKSGGSTAGVQVRACMLLAMLTGGAPEAQAALAATPGAAAAILGVMRGPGGDAEARAVAQHLFKMLAANPDTKAVVEAALRGTPAS